jgi:superfamily II DNA or RNA helicase
MKRRIVTSNAAGAKKTCKAGGASAAAAAFVLTEEYRAHVCAHAYLGQKGYTIPKAALDPADLVQLCRELFVQPVVHYQPGMPTSGDELAFRVYRDNPNKIYVPRFYGLERYGVPTTSPTKEGGVSEGDDIDVPFAKTLRDYQEPIVKTYLDHVAEKRDEGCCGGILEVPCAAGKTVMALHIISQLRKKTLILVHKEFLMNQWIERIQEFLPTARVGKIQAHVFDIVDKDIVLGMIQTLFSRDYAPTTFDSFGLTIVDEVHRIGSEQFSKTLFKAMTRYMLGISATVDRKDDLTRVLYWFIGPKIYEQKRRSDDAVCVQAITYVSHDPEFNEVEHDFRGQPKYSTMLTKLAHFGPRSDFIVRILQDVIRDHPAAQIMVLAHARALLTYFHEAVRHRGFATVGYYVGGMKQAQLQETETKQIVLATYAMAAEALDIKTLSILVMATPKTDITQSVGRILRVKHAQPIVVDIVDTHDLFQNQWQQRRRFYRKCNYRIEQTTSSTYPGGWTTTFVPKATATATATACAAVDEEDVPKCLVRWTADEDEDEAS